MPLKHVNPFFYLNSTNRKLIFIELKLEIRKTQTRVANLNIGTHIKKFYLLFLVVALLIPLFAINPSAKQDNKLIQIASNFEKQKNQSITFAQPASVIPTIDNLSSQLYNKYILKEGEDLTLLMSRVPNLKKESITINNPGKEIKPGNEIIIPKENGLLIGFNKSTNTKELADGLKKNESELNETIKSKGEGYFFVPNNDPSEAKREFDVNLSRSRYSISNNVRVNIAPQYNVNESSAVDGEDLSSALNSFIAQYKGRRHHDGNGWSMGECVSLVKRWQQFIGAAYGIWPGYNGYPRNAWAGYKAGDKGLAPENATFGVMIISDVNSLKPGDILVIDTPTSHTGMATGKYYGNTYEVFDQNSPVGSGARFTSYSKSSFISALRYYRK
jgi:hypothetical protein